MWNGLQRLSLGRVFLRKLYLCASQPRTIVTEAQRRLGNPQAVGSRYQSTGEDRIPHFPGNRLTDGGEVVNLSHAPQQIRLPIKNPVYSHSYQYVWKNKICNS